MGIVKPSVGFVKRATPRNSVLIYLKDPLGLMSKMEKFRVFDCQLLQAQGLNGSKAQGIVSEYCKLYLNQKRQKLCSKMVVGRPMGKM